MLKLSEAEERHKALKRRVQEIAQAIDERDDISSIHEEIGVLLMELRAFKMNLRMHREMVEYLIEANPYGPPQ
jgi:hypothetical protein